MVTLQIDNMSCAHCVARVRGALESLPGVAIHKVVVGAAVLDLSGASVTSDQVAERLAAAGYPAREVTGEQA